LNPPDPADREMSGPEWKPQERAEDTPLYHLAPESRLQHRALPWVASTFVTTMMTIGIVAIATGTVASELLITAIILASAILLMTQTVFPMTSSERKPDGPQPPTALGA
jgi:hypothetical protein